MVLSIDATAAKSVAICASKNPAFAFNEPFDKSTLIPGLAVVLVAVYTNQDISMSPAPVASVPPKIAL